MKKIHTPLFAYDDYDIDGTTIIYFNCTLSKDIGPYKEDEYFYTIEIIMDQLKIKFYKEEESKPVVIDFKVLVEK